MAELKPEYIMLHHSLTRDSDTVSWGAIRKYHVDTLGWSQIGYHFGIELMRGQQEIVLGRMMNTRGAHCPQGGMNRKALSICFVGNFDELPPLKGQWRLGIKLVKSLMEIFNIPIDNIYGHRDFNPKKTCPGKRFSVEALKNDLKILPLKKGEL